MTTDIAYPPRMLTAIQMNGAALEAVYVRLRSSVLAKSAYLEIVAGLNALAYRLLSCADASKAFTASIGADGEAPRFPSRLSQEKALFEFFINGASAIESLAYSLHCIAMALDHGELSMDENKMRVVTPGTVYRHYVRKYGSEKLTLSLRKMVNATTFAEWKRIRNVLIHRGTPGRDIVMGTGVESSGVQWRVGISLDNTTTADRLKWLREAVNPVLDDLSDFLTRHLPKNPY